MTAEDASPTWLHWAGSARRPAPAWAVAALALPAAVAIVLAGRAIGGLLPAGPPPALLAAGLYLLTFGSLLGVAVGAGALEGRRVLVVEARWPAALAGGVAIGAAGFGLAAMMAALAGVVVRGPAAPHLLMALGPGLLMVGLQAFAEEAYFRGWVQPALCQRWGVGLGVAVTAVLFAATHLAGGARSPLTLANLLLAGVFFGLLAMKTGGLLASTGAHFAWNWVEMCGLGLEPNPGVGPFGTLTDLDLAGVNLWGGGAEGLNSGLPVTVVLLALLALAAGFGPPTPQRTPARA